MGVHHYHWLQARKYQGFMTVCSKKLDKFPPLILCHTLKNAGNSISWMRKLQKQINCSLFALAFATDLCHGLDLVTEEHDQQNMSPYLRCLDLEEMVPLSKASWLVPYHASENITNVVVFCVWRMLNDKKAVQCFQGNGWYHPTSVSIPDWMIKSNRRWKCDTIAFKTPWWVLAASNPRFSSIFPHLIWYTYALSSAILFSEVIYLKWLDCLLEQMYDVTAL